MDRLTARSPKNNMAYLVNIKNDEQALEGSYNTLMCVRDALERLARYEDTGLVPEEIIKLKSVAIQACLLYEICADLPIDFPSADRFVWTMGELKAALVAAGY